MYRIQSCLPKFHDSYEKSGVEVRQFGPFSHINHHLESPGGEVIIACPIFRTEITGVDCKFKDTARPGRSPLNPEPETPNPILPLK